MTAPLRMSNVDAAWLGMDSPENLMMVTGVLRLDRARALLGRGTPAGPVAARCGYTDQSHLVREFRALAGCTPGTYLAELDGEQVTFVQDDVPVAA